MSKEYSFSKDIKRESLNQAKAVNIKPDSIHHLCPCSLAKKYNLPKDKIVCLDNALALEQDFHDAIHHGGKFVDQETGEMVEIDAFEEEDYIYLAIALLGLSESDFNERNIYQSTTDSYRKTKVRRRKRRRH